MRVDFVLGPVRARNGVDMGIEGFRHRILKMLAGIIEKEG